MAIIRGLHETTTLPLAADYQTTSKRYYMMDINTSGRAVLVSAQGQRAIGVLDEKPTGTAVGTVGSIRIAGVAKAVAGDVIDEGYDLTTDSSGRLIQRTSANEALIGRALSPAAAAGVTFEFEFQKTSTDVVLGSDAVADLWYKSAATTWVRLAKGTAQQLLAMNSGATAPEWIDETALEFTFGSDAIGDIIYKSATNAFSRLGIGDQGTALGVSEADSNNIPAWEVQGPSSKYNYVFEDFLGATHFLDNATRVTTGAEPTGPWVTTQTETTGNAVIHALVADADDGQYKLGFSNDAEEQAAALYWGDEGNMPGDKDPIVVFRLKIDCEAALVDSATEIAWGICDARNNDPNAATHHASFSIDGNNLSLLIGSDDNSAPDVDNDTGVTLTKGTFYEFMIDASDVADVQFKYRSTLGGTWATLIPGTAFPISGAANFQPYVQLHKSADTNQDAVAVDYIKAIWDRS